MIIQSALLLSALGAHLNPAVSLSLCFLGRFPWTRLPFYIISQVFGAFLAAATVALQYFGERKRLCFYILYIRCVGGGVPYVFVSVCVSRCHNLLQWWPSNSEWSHWHSRNILHLPCRIPEHLGRSCRPGEKNPSNNIPDSVGLCNRIVNMIIFIILSSHVLEFDHHFIGLVLLLTL